MNSDEFRYEKINQEHYAFLETLLTDQDIAKNFSKGKDYQRLEIHQILDQMIDFWNKYSFGIFVVYKNNKPIGIAGFKYITNFQSIEILYCLSKDYWGYGFASKIAKNILNYGIFDLKLKEIYGVALSDNIGSVNILKKIGMNLESEQVLDGKPYSVFKITNNFGLLTPRFENIVEIDL
jgi:RimJ/RimL family protein N-acetyltransferase